MMAGTEFTARAVVMRRARELALDTVRLTPPRDGDVVVDIELSGISTGTERLLWDGTMPAFPGMGYPLVPGYESVGRVVGTAGDSAGLCVGDRVFVPGAQCYAEVRGLFGGAASRVVVPASRLVRLGETLGQDAVLLALAATAHHALAGLGELPELIVGHGALGRLLARLCVLRGTTPVVWERDPLRRAGGTAGYAVVAPEDDPRRDYRCACDASGAVGVLDDLVARLAPAGEVVLAGFYPGDVRFAFVPAFMRELRLRIAAQWQPDDMRAVLELAEAGALSLDAIVSHRCSPDQAQSAYSTAFNDAGCLKMVLDWRTAP